MKKLFFLSMIVLAACGTAKKVKTSDAAATPLPKFVFEPLTLNAKNTTVYLTDYTTQLTDLRNLKTEGVQLLWDGKTDTAVLQTTPKTLAMAWLSFTEQGMEYRVPLRRSLSKQTQMYVNSNGHTYLKLKGTFTNWKTVDLPLEDGYYVGTFELGPGVHQYVLVNQNGEMPDPNNPLSMSNGMGGTNSIIENPIVDINYTCSLVGNELIVSYEQNSDLQFMVLFNNTPVPFTQQKNVVKVNVKNCPNLNTIGYLRIWAYNSKLSSTSTLIPVLKKQVVQSTALLPRTDMHSAVIYNPMIDRFYNGNPKNDRPLNRPDVHPKVDFHGGDVAGITAKINEGYFDSLGINTLWISPVVKNPEGPYGQWSNPSTKFSGYHGYWPVSSTLTDPRFCTEQELKTFIATAHKHNINVLLDYVAHHIHMEHPTYKTQPNWYTPLYLPDGTKNTEKWDDYRLTTWFDDFLPTFNFANKELVNQQTDSALFWFKKYDIDGFRHDATKHIPENFWRSLNYKLRSQITEPSGRSLYQIGETYGSPQLISSYMGPGLLDAQFDFNLYDAMVNAFSGNNKSFVSLAKTLNDSRLWYGAHHTMGNITGNQDKPRFVSIADGSVPSGSNTKQVGWDKDIQVQDQAVYDNLVGLVAFTLAVPGVPILYYGDEIGMPGANDPDSRRDMKFTNLSKPELQLRKQIADMIKFRRNSMALCYGLTQVLYLNDSSMVLKRNYLNKTVIIAWNRHEKTISIPITNINGVNKMLFGLAAWTEDKLILPANSCEFFYNEL